MGDLLKLSTLFAPTHVRVSSSNFIHAVKLRIIAGIKKAVCILFVK